jgi:hypothetical protein
MPETDDKLKDIHREALEEFNDVIAAVRDEREQSLEDRRFCTIAGAQYEGSFGVDGGDLEAQYESKPKPEINKVHLSTIRIENEYRNNRITVDFESKSGDENDELADTLDALHRADEEDSNADEAYDNAFGEGVGGGIGGWRYGERYEDEEDEEDERQRITIEPIYDADSSIYFDLGAKKQNKSDAKRCWVITSMAPKAYKEEWDDDPSTWPKDVTQTEFDWYTADVVYVAEYYVVEKEKGTVFIYQALDEEEERYTDKDFANDETLRAKLEAVGSVEIRQKPIKRQRVHKYIMDGVKVIEDCGLIAGKHIPIVPFYGKRWFIDNVERFMGHTRLQKDVQRLRNMQYSRLAEISAVSATPKPIFTKEQMAGHETEWAEDNLKNFPCLTINSIMDANGQEVAAGPVGYTKAPEIPPALAALIQLTDNDQKDLSGNQEAGEKVVSNIAEDTVDLIHQRLDMQTFIYMSNMAKAKQWGGEIWLSKAQEIYVEDNREMRGIGTQKEIKKIILNRPVLNPETKEATREADIANAKFKISTEIGPASNSKRQSTIKTLTNMRGTTQDPQDQKVLSALILMNTEGEGMGDVREYYRKQLVGLGVLKPTDQDIKEQQEAAQAQSPDPTEVYLAAVAEKSTAQAGKAQADTVKTIAETEKIQAETAETLAGISRDDRKQVVETVKAINEATAQPPSMGANVEGMSNE